MFSLNYPMLPHGIRLLIAAFLLLLGACSNAERQLTTLERIQSEGVLRIVTLNGPTTCYLLDSNSAEGSTQAGPECDLAQQFAESLGVRLQIINADSLDEVYRSLTAAGGPHMAAAGLFESSARAAQARFTKGYAEVNLQVVFRQGQPAPGRVEDLVGQRISVVRGSVQAEWLAAQKQKLPKLEYTEVDDLDVQDLLSMVDDGELDVTIVGANELAISQFSLANVRIGFELPQRSLVWALPPGGDDSLLLAVNQFFARLRGDGSLQRLQDRYYGHTDLLDYVGTYTFAEHLQKRLPQYEKDFRTAAEGQGLDWRLLAAIGYQESMWQADAVSKTGVRGLMMLTQNTAQSMGVSNRLDPKQSIHGGARHFSAVYRDLPDSIHEPDRTWFALAAYNVGAGHLEDARRLTQSAGLDPDKWLDVKKILPRLSKKRWYSKTRYGYARGGEPVAFVNNIRRYYDILNWVSQPRLEGGQLAAAGEHRPGVAPPAAQQPAATPPRL